MLQTGSIIYLDQTTSTMDEAAKLATEGAEHFTCVVAQDQTSGRGRRGRSWTTLPGHSLAFTLILHQAQPQVPLQIAFALAMALREMGANARIKWPNDILINGRKVAGILIEKQKDNYLVGVGLNISTPAEGLPENVPGTTLQAEGLQDLNHEKVLHNALKHVKECIEQRFDTQLNGYIDLCSTLGKKVSWHRSNEHIIEGIADHIDAQGALHLVSGSVSHKIESGDIIHD